MNKLLMLSLLVPALALAQAPAAEKPTPKNVAQPTPKGRPNIPGVDWNRHVIKATGRGAPSMNAPSIASARINAERAAELDALRNILSALKGVQVKSGENLGEAMGANDSVKSSVEGEAKGFKRVETRYFSDGGVELDVEMTLDGLFASLIGEEADKAAAQLKVPTEGEAKNTGLVVDATGLKAKPAIAPRLLDEDGKELFNASVVTKDAIKQNGIAGYLKKLDEAKKNARVGDKPLVVKATRLAGDTDLVLTKEDAARLRDPKSNLAFLTEGKVIIVTE